MYVFGYGSLIWNPGFQFQTSELAEIKNYKRSFSMWSIHHRGTVKRPGLVLALEKCNGHSCKGVVFRYPQITIPKFYYIFERENSCHRHMKKPKFKSS